MNHPVFSDNCRTTPYWWDDTPRETSIEAVPPARADVVVVGAGYTGLGAALQTSRGGRDTLVLDAADAGWGCSSRNGGLVSTSLKPEYSELAALYGDDRARAILGEGRNALRWIEEFVAEEKIDCRFTVGGKFVGAHNPVQYERLGKKIDQRVEGLDTEAHLVPRAEQRREIGSDFYHGGMVFPNYATLDPARLHQGLLRRTREAGATVIGHCPVTAIERDGDGFRVSTAKGPVKARDLVVASNGYTGPCSPWMRRRVIPIGSYIIATEPLEKSLLDRLMPGERAYGDTRRLVVYYRASPDRKRIVFGGRVSLNETDPMKSGVRLHDGLVRLFPELAGTRVSHSWNGFVAYTFDTLPHLGRKDGIYYAMGYCGSGVSMANYLGMRIGQQLLGLEQGKTALDGLEFETRPLYTGSPWFLSASVLYYRCLDRLSI